MRKTKSGILINGEPWTVAKDVCDALGLVDSTSALRTLRQNYESIGVDTKGIARSNTLQTPGGKQNAVFLSESATWVKYQIERGRFIENKDYVVFTINGGSPTGKLAKNGEARSAVLGSNKTEYHFTIEAGKHIAMMSNTEKGRDVRDYFIQCEKIAKQDEPETHTPSEEKSDMNLPVCKTHFYNNGRAVRSIIVDDNPWFMAKDVCDLVEVVDSTSAFRTLRQNYESIGIDIKGVLIQHPLQTPGGKQNLILTKLKEEEKDMKKIKKAKKKVVKADVIPFPFRGVRGVERDGKPWGVDKKDLAKALGYADVEDMMEKLDREDSRAFNADDSIPNQEAETLDMTAVRTFIFQGKHKVRVIDRDGKPWFVAEDLAEVLGYSDVEAMTRQLDKKDVSKVFLTSMMEGVSPNEEE